MTTYVTQRAGWIVLREADGSLVAEEVGGPGARWPVAPVIEVSRAQFVVECPSCDRSPRAKRPRRHRHGRSTGLTLGEGHRLGHGPRCSSRGYVVLLLDADAVTLTGQL